MSAKLNLLQRREILLAGIKFQCLRNNLVIPKETWTETDEFTSLELMIVNKNNPDTFINYTIKMAVVGNLLLFTFYPGRDSAYSVSGDLEKVQKFEEIGHIGHQIADTIVASLR
jgi:hypothetical protein